MTPRLTERRAVKIAVGVLSAAVGVTASQWERVTS